MQVHEGPSKVFAIRGEVGERLPMAKAKARGQAGLDTPAALVPELSTPSTDARSRPSGSSEPRGTSHKAQMGRMAGSVPLGEEVLGDRGAL